MSASCCVDLVGERGVLVGELQQRLEVTDVALQRLPGLELARRPRVLGADLRRDLLVIPEPRRAHPPLELRDRPRQPVRIQVALEVPELHLDRRSTLRRRLRVRDGRHPSDASSGTPVPHGHGSTDASNPGQATGIAAGPVPAARASPPVGRDERRAEGARDRHVQRIGDRDRVAERPRGDHHRLNRVEPFRQAAERAENPIGGGRIAGARRHFAAKRGHQLEPDQVRRRELRRAPRKPGLDPA